MRFLQQNWFTYKYHFVCSISERICVPAQDQNIEEYKTYKSIITIEKCLLS